MRRGLGDVAEFQASNGYVERIAHPHDVSQCRISTTWNGPFQDNAEALLPLSTRVPIRSRDGEVEDGGTYFDHGGEYDPRLEVGLHTDPPYHQQDIDVEIDDPVDTIADDRALVERPCQLSIDDVQEKGSPEQCGCDVEFGCQVAALVLPGWLATEDERGHHAENQSEVVDEVRIEVPDVGEGEQLSRFFVDHVDL